MSGAQDSLQDSPIDLWVANKTGFKLPPHLSDLPLRIVEHAIADFGRDESGGEPMRLRAVFMPTTEEQLTHILRHYAALKKPITIASANTGLSRGAVPQHMDEEVLCLREFLPFAPKIGKDSGGKAFVVVPAGMRLMDLQQFVESQGLYYPPDPTERSALIGGNVATNASGPRSFMYGATREWVRALRVMLASGEILDLRRGQTESDPQGTFKIPMSDGTPCVVSVPRYTMPKVKNAAGYYAKPGMDLIDLFIGSEGTLGIIT